MQIAALIVTKALSRARKIVKNGEPQSTASYRPCFESKNAERSPEKAQITLDEIHKKCDQIIETLCGTNSILRDRQRSEIRAVLLRLADQVDRHAAA
jgi:hypothetical protein